MSTSSKIKIVINDVIKPSEDKRLYRGIELQNGLKALLISDPGTDKSSAALNVNIGFMCDPDEIPGLAHFCEHMLFMGTEKYPEENAYSKFLSEHGGSSNAYTSVENTNYYFDVSPDHLTGAFDRFAQFFICPLFTEAATSRELNAVNSENDKNLQNDSWRINQLEKSTCNPSHAFSKFGTGNKDTLETYPKQKGIDLRQELLKFHDKYYSSNIISLVVLGKESLDELTTLVTDRFADVKNKDVATPEWLEHPLGPKEVKMMLKITPIKDIRTLTVIWPIPDLHPFYKTNPSHYLGHLIGHEGPGSLLSELKKKGWVNNLSAGDISGAKGFMFFNINVDLTEEGIENVDAIVSLMYQYLNMLREEGPKEWIYKECQDVCEMGFRFKDKEKPSNYTCKLASALQYFPLTEVLSYGYLFDDFKPELIDMLLSKLNPDSTRVILVGKKFEGETKLSEKWYGTNYSIEAIPEATIKKWREVGTNPCFKLPEVNDFIASDLCLLPVKDESPLLPTIIHETPMSQLWYCQDNQFGLPKCCFTIQLSSPAAYADPLSANLMDMFEELLSDALNEYTYSAELAGISYNITSTIYGLRMNTSGYNDKQHKLLEKIVDKIVNFEVDEQRFAIIKESYIRNLKNFRAEQPHEHAVYYMSMLVSEQYWTKDELLEAADGITIPALNALLNRLFSQLYIECLVYGNVSKDKAALMLETVEKPLIAKYNTRPLAPSQRRKYREFQLPDGCCYQYKRENEVHKSSSLETYYQCCLQETNSNMLLELFCQIISEPCFDILRTQEQLGYIVFSGLRRLYGVQGLRIIVQSDKPPSYVDQRIEVFMKKMKSHIETMDEEVFNKHLNALASKRLEKPKKMFSQNSVYWEEISNQFYNFKRDEIEVGHLRTLTKADVLKFYQDLLAHDAPKRHKLTVHVVSTAPENGTNNGKVALTPSVDADDNSCATFKKRDDPDGTAVDEVDEFGNVLTWTEIDDVSNFKRLLGLFPLPKPTLPLNRSKL